MFNNLAGFPITADPVAVGPRHGDLDDVVGEHFVGVGRVDEEAQDVAPLAPALPLGLHRFQESTLQHLKEFKSLFFKGVNSRRLHESLNISQENPIYNFKTALSRILSTKSWNLQGFTPGHNSNLWSQNQSQSFKFPELSQPYFPYFLAPQDPFVAAPLVRHHAVHAVLLRLRGKAI